jgi:hypothetical protein
MALAQGNKMGSKLCIQNDGNFNFEHEMVPIQTSNIYSTRIWLDPTKRTFWPYRRRFVPNILKGSFYSKGLCMTFLGLDPKIFL